MIEYLRRDERGRVIDTQYRLVSRGEVSMPEIRDLFGNDRRGDWPFENRGLNNFWNTVPQQAPTWGGFGFGGGYGGQQQQQQQQQQQPPQRQQPQQQQPQQRQKQLPPPQQQRSTLPPLWRSTD